MEWGNFWSSHLPRTSYDIDLDGESPNSNDQVNFSFNIPLSSSQNFFSHLFTLKSVIFINQLIVSATGF